MMWFTLLIECMEVQWDKFIIERLPVRLRTELMKAVCLAVTLPVVQIYNEFRIWKKRMDIKAGGSPQVCMLQKIVKDTLDIDLIISEGNGKPVDFIIHTSFTDVDKERQLFALLDRYKLAGKSYMYENAEVEYSQQWSGFVCERQTLLIQWQGYVCEVKTREVNYISARINNSRIYVKQDYPPTSDIRVTYAIYRDNGNGGIEVVCSADFQIQKGEKNELSKSWNGSSNPLEIEVRQDVYRDDYYIYTTRWQ